MNFFCSCSTTVIQNVNKAQVKIRAKKDNVAGDKIVGLFLSFNNQDIYNVFLKKEDVSSLASCTG